MYRRVVSLFLLPCLLLTQSAVLRHSHGGSEPAGHDFRAHFHTKSASASGSHHHGHHHHDSGDHRHHDDSDNSPQPENQPPALPEPVPDHNSDAVFIASVDLVIGGRASVDDALTESTFWATLWSNPTTVFSANPPHQVANWTRGPPPCGCVCPLYLRYLALLI